MAKISRPIVYTALLGVIAYSYVVVTEPEARRKRPTLRRPLASASVPIGFTQEDSTARFPRYTGKGRDAFAPKVVGKKPQNLTPTAFGDAASGIWLLTGVNLINGTRSALLENGRTGEAVFLRAGERWNGMLVQTIEPNAVVFVNEKGKVTRMPFVDPQAEKVAGVAPVLVPPAVASVPVPIRPGAQTPPLVIPAPVRNQP